jgi:hypothetical protein
VTERLLGVAEEANSMKALERQLAALTKELPIVDAKARAQGEAPGSLLLEGITLLLKVLPLLVALYRQLIGYRT